MNKYLTVVEAAEYLNTSVRFVRRLIAERRIAFHKVGAHVRFASLISNRLSRPGGSSRSRLAVSCGT
jgi:excisionase family DNA binding protein